MKFMRKRRSGVRFVTKTTVSEEKSESCERVHKRYLVGKRETGPLRVSIK